MPAYLIEVDRSLLSLVQTASWLNEVKNVLAARTKKASLLLYIVNVLLADNPEGQPTCLTEEIDCEVMGCVKSKCQPI